MLHESGVADHLSALCIKYYQSIVKDGAGVCGLLSALYATDNAFIDFVVFMLPLVDRL